MKRAITLLIPVLALTSGHAMAGDSDEHEKQKKKCGAEATICIREMAEGLKKRGWIGIEWGDKDPRPTISHVVAGSPAAKAGVRVGDIVMAFEGISTDEDDEVIWAAMKRSLVPRKVITLAIVRDGNPLELPVELVAVPEHIIAQWVGKHVLDNHAAAPEAEAPTSP